MKIAFRRIAPEAIMPTRASAGAAGYDLFSSDAASIPKAGIRLVGTGISIALPRDYEAQIRPRSGLALRHGLTVLNSPGTIDSDYRGEIKILLINLGRDVVEIRPGDRIAQIVIAPLAPVELVEVDQLDETKRGAGGFGSTGISRHEGEK